MFGRTFAVPAMSSDLSTLKPVERASKSLKPRYHSSIEYLRTCGDTVRKRLRGRWDYRRERAN